jgi:hypothetical protein
MVRAVDCDRGRATPGPRDPRVVAARSVAAGGFGAAGADCVAAEGVPVNDIVARVGVSNPTVIGWKKRYRAPRVWVAGTENTDEHRGWLSDAAVNRLRNAARGDVSAGRGGGI